MNRFITTTLSALVVAVTLVLQLGCAKQQETSPSGPNRWLELLRVLPENETTLQAAYLRDIAYMNTKIPPTENPSSVIPISRNLPIFGSNPGAYSDEEWKSTLGFVRSDVDQTVYAGTTPIVFYQALRGRFKQADVDNAARTGPGKDMLEVVDYQGRQFYSWGDDNQINLSFRSNLRPQGRGYRLALLDDFAVWVQRTDQVKQMIDAFDGKTKSLADNDAYRSLAGGLVKLDTVTALFSSQTWSASSLQEANPQITEIGSPMKERFLGELNSDVKLKPYLALATGAGRDDKGYYLAIALVSPDEKTAQENAGLLEQRINQAKIVWGRSAGDKWAAHIDGMVIEASGKLTLARLYGDAVQYWDAFVMPGQWSEYEPLLLHE